MIQFRKLILSLTVCLFALFALLIPRAVLAHANYERSEPEADAVVVEAPTQVRVWVTQDLFRRQGMNRIEVYNEAGERVDQDDAAIDDDNRRLMTVSLAPELPPAVYTVRWYTLSSEDGHEGEGEFVFTVGAEESTTGTSTTALTETNQVESTDTLTATEITTDVVTETATSPTLTPSELTVEAAPTEPPASTSAPAFPCVGGAAPLMLVLGMAWSGQRRMSHPQKRLRM